VELLLEGAGHIVGLLVDDIGKKSNNWQIRGNRRKKPEAKKFIPQPLLSTVITCWKAFSIVDGKLALGTLLLLQRLRHLDELEQGSADL
jgi:hypothetical protein